jgi:hypothetical protein
MTTLANRPPLLGTQVCLAAYTPQAEIKYIEDTFTKYIRMSHRPKKKSRKFKPTKQKSV